MEPTSPVERVGETVRRPAGPWTPAVHAVLRHLEAVGFEGAPRALGVDDEGREVVSWLPSEPTWPYSEEVLVGAARLVRRLHDALADFLAPPGATWRFSRAVAGGPTGHNDIGPNNTVFAGGRPYGFIDWELAGPGPAGYDLVWAAINFVPLRPDIFCQRVGFRDPPDRAGRLRRFCDEYGVDDRLALLDTIEAYEADGIREIVELGTAGVSPYHRFLARGEHRYLEWDLEWFRAHRAELEAG